MRHFLLLFLFLLLNVFSGYSQEDNSPKFGYRSFSVSPSGFYVGGNVGFALAADVSFDYGKNIFSLDFGAGSELSIFGASDDYTQVNLLYGRSFALSKKIFTDIYVGAGYFHFNTYGVIDDVNWKYGDIEKTTIGVPIGAKFQFLMGPRYSMGIKLGANINSAESILTIGLVLQWNRKRN